MYDDPDLEEWLPLLGTELRDALHRYGSHGDIEWLLLRVDDTIRYTGRRRYDSGHQLRRDVADFASEHPAELSAELVASVTARLIPRD